MSAASVPPALTGEASPFRSIHTVSLPALLEQPHLDRRLDVSGRQVGSDPRSRRPRRHALQRLSRTDGLGLAATASPSGRGCTSGNTATNRRSHARSSLRAITTPAFCRVLATSPATSASTRSPGWASELWFVNTGFSCLCTLDIDYSFVPRWRPPFITGYSPEDRCHLNGLGLRDGTPDYADRPGPDRYGGRLAGNKRPGRRPARRSFRRGDLRRDCPCRTRRAGMQDQALAAGVGQRAASSRAI